MMCLPAPSQPPSVPTYDSLLVTLATYVLAGCLLWALLIAVAGLVEVGTAGRVRAMSWVATPPGMQRAILAVLGVALAGGLPGPVSAAATASVVGAAQRPSPLPVPARTVDAPRVRTGQFTAQVVVRPGDTLWALARAHVPAGSSDRQVLEATERWHARNRAVIGADPDLIRPGQVLHPPHQLDTEEHR